MKNILILLVLLLLVSCKKKESSESPANNSNPTSTPIPHALLGSTYSVLDSMGYVKPEDSTCYGMFSKSETFLTSDLVSAGVLKINDTVLYFDGQSYSNMSPSSFIVKRVDVLSNYTWSSSGSSYFPSFNYTVTNLNPFYSGGYLLPDTVSKSTGFAVPVVSKFNSTSGYYELGLDYSNFIRDYPMTNDSIKMTPQMLSGYATGNRILKLGFGNSVTVNMNNNTFYFVKWFYYHKFIYLKP